MLFDEIVLLVYILTMIIILIFASHGIIMLFYHRKYIENIPKSNADFNYDKKVTIQLPLYNEKYVAERLIETVCKIDYPRELLEIQVLDDSTDDTKNLVNKIVKEKKSEGFDIKQIHRKNRKGYKAGALKEGLIPLHAGANKAVLPIHIQGLTGNRNLGRHDLLSLAEVFEGDAV